MESRAQAGMNDLIAEDLDYAYDGRPAVRGASLRLAAGRVHALVGPSGSGKSTLLWLLAGLIEPHAGAVRVERSADEPPGSGRPPLGMVFQPPLLWEHLSAARHLELALSARRLGRLERKGRVAAMLLRVGLKEFAGRRASDLSSGQRQRLALARAVVAQPRRLLLDEPMAHLDGPSRWELFELLRELLAETGAGVLIATHHADEAMRLADEVSVMIGGRIVQHGPPAEVYHQPVSLAAALALGPAFELRGRREGDALVSGNVTVLTGLAGISDGETALILRPGDVAFHPDPAGSARVERCELAGGAFMLTISVAGQRAMVEHGSPVAPGSAGALTWRGLYDLQSR